MSDTFSIIVRKEATNLILNPSFEVNVTDGWTGNDNGVGASFARSTIYTYYGTGAATISGGNATAYYGSTVFTVAAGETVYVQCMSLSSTLGKNALQLYDTTNGQVRIYDAATTTTWEKLFGNWTNSTGSPAVVTLQLYNLQTDGTTLVVFDAVQAEIGTAETTYIDGDQPGCKWNGEAHNSTSTRSPLSYDGGISYDFVTDLYYYVGRTMGLSGPPVSNTFQPYALRPGSFFNGSKVLERPFTLFGDVVGTSFATLQDRYKIMQDVFAVRTGEEVRIEYSGGTSKKWFKARYESGLEGDYGFSLTQAPANIRMISASPDMYQVNDTNTVLDTNDTATLYYIARRSRSTGQWGNMGITAVPTAGGTIYAILAASDGKVYIGGNFTHFNNQAEWDYGVIYDPQLGTFAQWGGDNAFNGSIYDLKEGPDGTIYAMGNFTAVGDANGNGIVSWTGAAFVSLAVPGATAVPVWKGEFDRGGYLHIVGGFEDFGGVANADGYAYWTGAAWATNGAPAVTGEQSLFTIAIDVDDNVYVGGDKDNIGGVTYDHIAMWNGTAWVDVGVGLSSTVQDMAVGLDGKTIYICGLFLNAGSAYGDRVVLWNGAQYVNLGSGLNAAPYDIKIAPNGDVYVSGDVAGISGFVNGMYIWNGSTWIFPDIGAWGAQTVEFANVDPKSTDNFDIYLGSNTSAAVAFAGDATVNNPGNADAYPTFIISRAGGTSATLYQIRNETTGKSIYFNRSLLNGETVTLTLSKSGSTFTSSYRGGSSGLWEIARPSPGNRGVLPNSDDGSFVLIPGDNLITCFVDIAGAVTMTANCLHKAVFTGIDD